MLSRAELQSAIKNYRKSNPSYKFDCRQKTSVLQAEYDRIRGTIVTEFAAKVAEEATVKESNTELEQLRLELECARAIIKEQQQRIEELEQQLQPVEAEVEAETKVEEQEPEAAQVLEVINKYNDYASFPDMGRELNLTPEQLHQLLYRLERAGVIELSTHTDPTGMNFDELHVWGIEQLVGGALFFAQPA